MEVDVRNPKPGVYFGMPDEVYHSLECLSATGMKKLLVSAMDFWAESWMNQYKETDAKESEAKKIGKAYHKRILEGVAAFADSYANKFNVADLDVLYTEKDLAKELRRLRDTGLPVLVTTKGKEDAIERVLTYNPAAKIYDVMLAEYLEDNPGVTFLDEKLMRRIELAAKMIECHDDLKYYFAGGYAEVSVIFVDPDTGILMKARYDYLKIGAVNDLKTFENTLEKEIGKAIYAAIASRKYHIAATFYLWSVDIARELMRAGEIFVWDGTPTPDPRWVQAFIQTEPESHVFNWVFQQKGNAPVSRGVEFPRDDRAYNQAIEAINDAKRAFLRNTSLYGDLPWVDTTKPTRFSSDECPSYINDI